MVTLITEKLQNQSLDDLACKSYDAGPVSCPPHVGGHCLGWAPAGGADGGRWGGRGQCPREAPAPSQPPEPLSVVMGGSQHP